MGDSGAIASIGPSVRCGHSSSWHVFRSMPTCVLAGTSLLLSLGLTHTSRAQSSPLPPQVVLSAQNPIRPLAEANKQKQSKAPDTGLIKADITIPSGPLGFAPPASHYLGGRISQVSLNFLDEDHLLFTFRVPGLISREHNASNLDPGEQPTVDPQHNERHVRALVLALPAGKVTAEALWRLHDSYPYLYLLKDRKFLLRDRNAVKIGDASLHLDLFLRFPGSVRNLEMGPDEDLLVANTVEPAAIVPQTRPASHPSLYADGAASSPASDNDADTHRGVSPTQPDQSLLRVFRMDDRAVMLFSRVDGVRHLPLDQNGFYEALRGNGTNWLISYQDFHGSSVPLQPIDSTCSPSLDVVAPGLVVSSACPPGGGRLLTAITRDKRRLWEILTPQTKIWAQITCSENGKRMARETLDVSHAVGPNYPLDASDIRGQSIQVYDLATGKLNLTVPAWPVLDGGGNFALSPSGNRLAVLNGGAIQVFNLSAAPPMPAPIAEARP